MAEAARIIPVPTARRAKDAIKPPEDNGPMNLSSLFSRKRGPLARLLGGGRADSVVAIEIGTTAVKGIHVRRSGTELVLDGYRVVRLGEPPAGPTLETAIRQALELRLTEKEPFAVALTTPGASIRRVDLPAMTPEELRQALPWEAKRHIAALADDAIVSAQVLSNGPTSGPMEVVLVAFPREPYDRIQNVWQELGVTPEFVDIGQLAAMNSVSQRPSSSRGPAALLDLGTAEGSFSIFSAKSLVVFRDLSPRITHLDTLLAEKLGLDPQQLEAFRASGKLPAGKTAPAGALDKVLADLSAELGEDIRSGLVYFENLTGGSIERIAMSGALAGFLERHAVTESLAVHAGVPLERFNPFQGYRLGVIDEIGLRACSSELCAAAGIAARYFSN